MAWLGVVFALVVGYELTVDVGAETQRALIVVGWVVWAVFLTEFLAHVYVAPRRLRYVRRHWFRVLALVIPTLRALRFVRLLRLGRAFPAARVVTSSYRVAGTARRLLQSRLAYLGALTVVVGIALAELAYLFERDRADGIFASFGDALLWSAAVVIAANANPVPESLGAHIAMLAGYAWAVVVFATLAGSLGAFFMEHRRECAEGEQATGEP